MFVSIASADIRRYAALTEIHDIYFEEDRLRSVLESIWTIVENKHKEAPELIIDYADPTDSEKVISLRIRELSAYRALELAGRKAGFNVTISPAAIVLSPGPDRAKSKARLSEQLALRNLLITAVEQGDKASLSADELRAFSETQITQAKVFRGGPNARGEIPIEFYCLAALKIRDIDQSESQKLLDHATHAGQLYLAALFPDITRDHSNAPIPFVPKDGLLYQTAEPADILATYIDTGIIAESVAALLPKSEAP